MALNFMGLGFTFGAKDAGLLAMQKEISSGFDRMFLHLERIEQSTGQMGKSVGEVIPAGADEKVNKMSEAVGVLSEKLGTELPEESRKGTEQFHRDSTQMESDERKIGGGMNFIRDAMEKLSVVARQNKLQTFIQAISLSKLNEIAGSLGEIGQQGMNLTTTFEATTIAASKTARQAGANFGYTGNELNKFSKKAAGMSIALNIGADEASQALRGWTEAADEMRAIGFKSANDLAKFSSTFGVNADVLRNSTLRMRKEFGMTDEQISQVVGSWTKMGQVTGDVGGALNMMPQMMDQLRRRAAMMGKELDPKELAEYAASTAGLAAAFMQSGQSSDQARESALGMSEQMLASKENFKAMFAGAADDLDAFQQSLGIAFGDIGVSMDMMGKSPGDFIAGLAGMIAQAKKTGKDVGPALDMIRGQLASTIGPDKAAELVNFFREGDAAAIEMMKNVTKAPADLGKLAKEGFRTGRTLAESFDLSKDRFIASFRSISRVHAKEFVKETGAEFENFNRRLRQISAKGGPMGAFVDKMSEIHSLGVTALIPEALRPMTTVFGEMVSQMTPAVTALGALGFRLKMLVNPFVLVAAAAGGLFAMFKQNESTIAKQDKAYVKLDLAQDKLIKRMNKLKTGSEAYNKLNNKVKSNEEKLAKMREKHAREARTKTIQQIEKGIQDAIVRIGMVGKALFEKMQEWWPLVQKFMKGMWDGLIMGVDPAQGGKEPATQWGLKLGEGIRHGLKVAAQAVQNYLKQWWGNMVSIWTDGSKPFHQKVMETMEGSAGLIIAAFAVAKFTPVFSILGLLAKGFGSLASVGATLATKMWAIGGAIKGFLGAIGSLLGFSGALAVAIGAVVAAVVALTAGFLAFPEKTKAFVDAASGYIRDFFEKIGYYLTEGVILLVKAIGEVISMLPKIMYEWLPKAADAFIQAVNSLVDWVVWAINGLLSGIEKRLVEAFPEAAVEIRAVFMVLRDIVWGLGEAVKFTLGLIVKMFQGSMQLVYEVVKGAVNAIIYVFKGIYNVVAGVFKAIYHVVAAVVEPIIAAFKGLYNFFAQILDGIFTLFVDPWEGIKKIVTAPVHLLVALWDGVKAFFSNLFEAVKGIFQAAWGVIQAIVLAPYELIKGVWNGIVSFFSSVWEGVSGAAEWVWDGIKDIILAPYYAAVAVWEGLVDFFSGLWDAISGAASAAWDFIGDIVAGPINVIKGAWGAVTGFFGGVWDGISGAAGAAWDAVSGAASSAWDSITDFFGGGSESVTGSIKTMVDEAAGMMDGAAKAAQVAAQKMADETKLKTAEAGTEIGGMTKTTSGQIIAAADAVTRYVMDAEGKIRETVHAANELKFGKIVDVKEVDDARQIYDEFHASIEGLKLGSDKYSAALDKLAADRKRFRESTGMDAGYVIQVAKGVEEAINIDQKAYDKLLSIDKDAAARFTSQHEQMTRDLAKRAVEIEGQRSLIGFEAANQRLSALRTEAASANAVLDEQLQILAGTWGDTFQQMGDETGEMTAQQEGFMRRMAKITADASFERNQAILGGISETNKAARTETEKFFADMAVQERAALQEIATMEGLSAAERVARAEGIKATYLGIADSVKAAMISNNADLQAGINDGYINALGEQRKNFTMLQEEAQAKTAEFQSTVQQQFGVTGDAAASMIQEIAEISPEKFKANIKVVKDEFISLLEMMREINQGVVELGPQAEKAFPRATKPLTAFANEFAKLFGEGSSKNIADAMDKVFDRILKNAEMLRTRLASTLEGLWDKILKNARAVVQELNDEIKRTARALNSLARVAQASAISKAEQESEGGGPVLKTTAQSKTFKGDLSGDKQLFEATHWPDWYTQRYQYQAAEMNAHLKTIALSLGALDLGEGGGTVTTATTRGGGVFGVRGTLGLAVGAEGQ